MTIIEQPFRKSLHPVTLNIGQASADFSGSWENLLPNIYPIAQAAHVPVAATRQTGIGSAMK